VPKVGGAGDPVPIALGNVEDLQRQLEEALSKAKAEATTGVERAAQAREQGYQQSCADPLGYLHKVLVTLA